MKLIYSGIALAMLISVGSCNEQLMQSDSEPNKYVNNKLFSFIK